MTKLPVGKGNILYFSKSFQKLINQITKENAILQQQQKGA